MVSSSVLRARSPSLPLLPLDWSRDAKQCPSYSGTSTPALENPDAGEGKENVTESRRAHHQCHKRKRISDANDAVELLGKSFVLKPQSSSSNPASHTLYPVLVLPRKHVPLSMLDFHSPFADIYAARRFSAPTIRIVDLETRRSGSPHVLVAVSQNHKLFVLDACDQGIFAICQIGYWVKLNDLTEKASICNWSIADKLRIRQEDKEKTREKTKKEAKESKRISLSRASSEANARPISNDKAKPAVSSLNSQAGPPKLTTTNLSSATRTSIPIVSQPTGPVIPPTPGSNAAPLTDVPPTSENIFDNTRAQYWEALYKSVGPLTYFAKGPLSRARAAFTIGTQDKSKMADLVAFLQDLIMTTAQLDAKYRDRIPQIIRDMKGFYNESDDNQADSRPKKRRQRKMKLGKDGLYPYEETKIRDWWRHNMPQLKDGAIITESDIKSYVSLLRVRETQLQLIIILEALALEPLAQVEEADKACEPVPISVLPDQIVASIETDRPVKTPVKKPKKRDLATLADILADRLGIWQSTISDELRMIQNSHVPKSSGEDTSKQMEMSSEPLKDFCIDVIIPFFAKRLPVVCESISEKLGGPSILPKKKPPKNAEDAPAHNSPALSIKKEKQMPGAVTKRTAQPRSSKSKRISLGQAMERAVAREERQSLHRSLSRGPSQIIEAMMATQPREVPGLKREFSESNLSRIKSDGSGLMKAPGLPHSQSMASVVGDPKARQKAIVEAELQNAISAIRKPNRELAGRAITDESARRASGGGLSQIRKTKKPQRIVPNSSPQVVKATPMRPRYRDIDASTSQRHSQHSPPAGESQYYSQYQSQSFTQHYNPDYHGHSLSAEVCQPISQSFPAPGYRPDDDVIGDTPATCRFKSFPTDEVTYSGIAEANGDDNVGETPARPQHTTINATPTNSHRTKTIHTPSGAFIAATPVSAKSRLPTINDNNGDDEDELALSPVFAQRASVRRSGGIKGLLFPRSGGRDSSGPMEFKSPSRAAAVRTPGMGMSSRIAPVVASSPFASATARSLAMKLNPSSSSIKDATMSKHIEFKPLLRDPISAKAAGQTGSKQTGSVFAQLGWDDEFDDI